MELFDKLEAQHGLPAGLLDSVWNAESSRGVNMRSSAGAQGHFQFMPATAKQYGVADVNDLTQSAGGAARMLGDLLRSSSGDLSKALAGYNWGTGNVQRQGMNAAPAETRNYIQKVTAGMGQAQGDDSSGEWGALARQFSGQAPTQAPAGGDPWAALGAQFSQATKAAPKQTAPAAPPTSFIDDIKQGAGNLAAGAVRGAGSIGATLLAPVDAAARALNGGKPVTLDGYEIAGHDRRAGMDAGLKTMGAEPDSWMYQGGKLAGEIAGTSGAGGVLGAGLRALPMLARAAPLIGSIGSSGMTAGGLTGMAGIGTRMAGGATAGGASAGLVDPSSIGGGAAIGAALPPVFAGIGRGAGLVRSGIQALRTPEEVRAANAILTAGGYTTPQQVDGVRSALGVQGPNIVSEGATVPQLLQNPGISQLQRTLRNSGDTALLQREAAQDTARFAALDRVSPVTGTVQQSAENFGNLLGPQVHAADELAQKNVRAAFQNIDPTNQTRLLLPISDMQRAQNTFLGPGTVGTGGRAAQVLQAAQDIAGSQRPGLGLMNTGTGQTAPFQVVQNLRSSAGELAQKASEQGANKEAAALREMVASIDARVNRAASGQAGAGEYFPQAAADQYRAALAAHQDRMTTFRTGPQASIFRQGGDGLPQAQGAELAPKFFSPRLSQADDAAGFGRIASPETSALLKNYAITDAANQTNRLGQLSNAKFSNWVDGRSGAIKGTFTDAERAQLAGVRGDLGRADAATSLGLATGSNTAQNVQSAMGLGMLDSKALNMAARRIPYVGNVTGPMLDALRESAKRGKVQNIGGLLADPEELARALALRQKLSEPKSIGLMESLLAPALLRSAPVVGAGSDSH